MSILDSLPLFQDNDKCRVFLECQRWPNGPACPVCGSLDRIQTRKVVGYFRCLSCKSDFTVRSGTIMERSHVPLGKWLLAFYFQASLKKPISSVQLGIELGITQKSAWRMLQLINDVRSQRKKNDPNFFIHELCRKNSLTSLPV